MPAIVSLGEPMFELAATEVGRLSETTLFERGFGGDTSNFAVAAARQGATVGYVCRLGGDDFGRAFLRLWEHEGVDASAVRVDPSGFTAIYLISQRSEGGHDFTYYRAGSAASRLAPEDLDPNYIGSARLLHTSGITQAISQSACEATFAAIEMARANGVRVSYDPNVRPRLWPLRVARAVVAQTVALADVVLPSLEDAVFLFGDQLGPDALLDRFLDLGPSVVALKLGGGGCLVGSASPDGTSHVLVPGFPIDVTDATGAGDAFDAAFVVAWLDGRPLEDGARYANAVGALTTAGRGAVMPVPTRRAAEEFLVRHRQISSSASLPITSA